MVATTTKDQAPRTMKFNFADVPWKTTNAISPIETQPDPKPSVPESQEIFAVPPVAAEIALRSDSQR